MQDMKEFFVCWFCCFFLFQIDVGESQVCTGVPENFLSISEVQMPQGSRVFLPSQRTDFQEWIFPNSLRFGCSGTIVGWVFRVPQSVSSNSISRFQLPRWNIYREDRRFSSPQNLRFDLWRSTGSFNELVTEETDQPGVYRYMLRSRVDVQVGDLVGVSYGDVFSNGNRLPISFLEGMRTPTSFRSTFPMTGSFQTFSSFVNQENRFIPLIAPIFDESGFTSPTSPIFQTTTKPATESSISTEATVITDQLATVNPLMVTDPQATVAMDTVLESQETPIITNLFVTMMPQEAGEPESSSENLLFVVAGVAAGLLAGALLTVTLVTVFLVLKRRKRRSLLPTQHIEDVHIGGNVTRTDAEINMVANKSYTSTDTVDSSLDYRAYDEIENSTKLPTLPRVHQQQDVERLTPNQAYNKTPPENCSVYTDQNNYVELGHHQQDHDVKLIKNLAYDVKATSIPVEPNQSYGIATLPVGPDQLYSTVEGDYGICTSERLTSEYEYVC